MPVPRETRRWSDEQLRNARAIINVGRSLRASDRDILIALMTAFQESGMRNLSFGDRDSLGLFQQRAGWGPRSARMDPIQSARMFFTGGMRPGTPGLLDLRNRNRLSLTQAAQAVQRSAFPNAYAKHESRATDLMKFLNYGTTVEPPIPPTQLPLTTTVKPVAATLEPMKPTTPLGLESPKLVDELAPGLKSPGAPGIEAGNTLPSLGMGFPSGGSTSSGFDLPPPILPASGSTYTGPRGSYRLPGVKPWVLEAAAEVGGKFGIKSIGGVGKRPYESDHPGGLALDFMTRGSTGDTLAGYVMANAARLGVKYVIWNQRIWSVARASEGWRRMKDRGSPTANHMDHVHVSFVAR